AVLTRVVAPDTAMPAVLRQTIRTVTGHYAQRGPVDSVVPTLLALNGAQPGVALPVLDGLAANWPREKIPAFKPDDEAKLAALMKSLSHEARSSLLTLADRWEKREMFATEVAVIAKG